MKPTLIFTESQTLKTNDQIEANKQSFKWNVISFKLEYFSFRLDKKFKYNMDIHYTCIKFLYVESSRAIEPQIHPHEYATVIELRPSLTTVIFCVRRTIRAGKFLGAKFMRTPNGYATQ